MKKLFTTLFIMVLATSTFAYDFSAVCESGQTLYFTIKNNLEVILTPPTPSGWYGYSEPTGDLIIPENVEYGEYTYTVVAINAHAFDYCQDLTSVVIPNSIRRIEGWAFAECTGLTGEIIIPEQCTFIGGMACYDCPNISSLTIGAAVDTIQWGAFKNCTGLLSIHCNTYAPPYGEHIHSYYFEDHELFENVPTNIPVYVSCLTMDQFQLSQDWSMFSNMQGVFVGAPSLSVDVNNPELGTVEIVSIPEDCDELTATVRAIPNPDHRFGYWKRGSNVVSFDPEYTFTLNHNTSLTAYFDCAAMINDSIAFPNHTVGRTFNDAGQVTNEYPSDFIYDENGTLTRFDFPTMLSSTYSFVDYPSMVSSVYTSYFGHPIMTENHVYQYNDFDQIMHSEHVSSMYGVAYYDYFYDDNHKLTIINHDVTDPDYEFHEQTIYEYENNYRTQIESYYSGYQTLLLNSRTTNCYDERLLVLTSQIEKYNETGEIIAATLRTFSYTPNNKIDHIITQTLFDGEWVNSSIVQYVYDDKNRVIEYQTWLWSDENEAWNNIKKTVYDFNDEEQRLTVSFLKKANGEWTRDHYSGQTLLYEPDLEEWEKALANYKNLTINQFEIDLHYETKEIEFPWQSEWYYEIVWDDGSTTYQHLEHTGDTTIQDKRPKVIVRSNTQYDKDAHTEVTHEYILEVGNRVYWWNNDLQEFTTLYDYNAEAGDEWEIKVGTESIVVHVDSVGIFEYQGMSHKMLHISDAGNIFDGDIVVGFGHMTSFFPERLMNQGKGFRVDGLRCYWVEEALLYHNGEVDCDAVHSELQDVNEDGPATPSTGLGALVVYPNPVNGILFIETKSVVSPSAPTEYRITNFMGQTVQTGNITTEAQQVDITKLPAGMYFINVGEQTVKFVKQ